MKERFNPYNKQYGIEMALNRSRQAVREGKLTEARNQFLIMEELSSGLIGDITYFINKCGADLEEAPEVEEDDKA